MIESDDTSYFQRRETDERRAAERANSHVARSLHLELADRYADQRWSLEEGYDLHLVRSTE